jgi:hypothetical protein
LRQIDLFPVKSTYPVVKAVFFAANRLFSGQMDFYR